MEDNNAPAEEIAELKAINEGPLGKRLAYFTKKSGPGWLQGAITLGGGSLAGALYLGVFAGNNMMWLQPLAMILGVIMLSAISYVTLSTGQRPFKSINEHVSPVLGWAWIIATLMANIVWCMPQFALGTAAVQQNLLGGKVDGIGSTWVIALILFVVAAVINFFYESGSKGIKLFEIILKILVGIVVISFFGVVVTLTVNGSLDWGAIFSGFVPRPSSLLEAAPTFGPAIEATGANADFWSAKIAKDQRDIVMTAFGTAVGINMTFLLPYSMLRKKWGKAHRGLAIFDLSIGLIIPFVLATACVVIASASTFHAQYGDVLNEDGTAKAAMAGSFASQADALVKHQAGDAAKDMDADAIAAARDALPLADRQLAAMLAKRDNLNLAGALEPLAGKGVSQIVFGVGVLGMALSTIIILMLINGFTICEMFNRPGSRSLHFFGAIIAGVGGYLGLRYLWSDSNIKAAMAIPTSVIGSSLLPIAYFTFLLLMNSRSVLGEDRIMGGRRLKWNILMVIATVIATAGSVWAIKDKTLKIGDDLVIPVGMIGIGVLIVLFILGTLGFVQKSKKANVDRQLLADSK
jgi:Mn2+/Fe2+ NRAMP family transporter